MRRRIWSEHVPYATVASRQVLDLLVRYGLELCVAVRPGAAAELPALIEACAARDVHVALWPMLGDEAGRWANERNAAAFASNVRALIEELEGRGLAPREIVFDLEPSIGTVRTLAGPSLAKAARAAAGATWRRGARVAKGRDAGQSDDPIAALVGDLRDRHIAASSAVVPLVLAGPRWARLLGTHVGPPTWDHVSVMLYTSILEGWSRGVLRRADVRAVLDRGCRAAVARLGSSAGVSLGAVGTGAFGNEPVYRDVSELADDVAVARAAGAETLTLFDLGGVLSRAPAQAWLEAFAHTEPARESPLPTPASRAAAWVATSVSQAGAGVLESRESVLIGSKK